MAIVDDYFMGHEFASSGKGAVVENSFVISADTVPLHVASGAGTVLIITKDNKVKVQKGKELEALGWLCAYFRGVIGTKLEVESVECLDQSF